MKLWQQNIELNKQVEAFTIGKDKELDIELAAYDVYTNMAHAMMLFKQGFLNREELDNIQSSLRGILKKIKEQDFSIEPGIEDIHSQIEFMLTASIGEAGKKIHLGRSRNDQVLTDIKMYFRDQLKDIGDLLIEISKAFLSKSEVHQADLMPGYTHSQIAMTSTFGLWFGAFAESFIGDLDLLISTIDLINRSPLGSAAGYGTSLPIDREFTSFMLGFNHLHINSIYAQMQRGKTEWLVANSLASIAQTASKISSDICLFTSANYELITLPDAFTTGSSIMPHKKNPDVYELIRGRCGEIALLPQRVHNLSNNLMTGYHRDYQLLKEMVFPELRHLKECLRMILLTIPIIQVHGIKLEDHKYQYLSTVDAINELVTQRTPFRDAYQQIKKEIVEGRTEFKPHKKTTHIGSIGNLGNGYLQVRLEQLIRKLNEYDWQKKIDELFDDDQEA